MPRWKRTLDIVICAAALPALIVVTLVVAIVMRITAPGPIFFRQERVGFKGRRFSLYKFRTMRVGAETASHHAHFAELVRSNAPMQKIDAKGDSRLIAGGWFLRASGIDELPQLINVLQGEMTVVGPRPCIPYEYHQYSLEQRERFGSVPGLTGLWQVSGKNRTTFEEMVQMDIAYGQRKSFGFDLKIILLTGPALAVQILEMLRSRRKATAARRREQHSLSMAQPPDSGTTVPL